MTELEKKEFRMEKYLESLGSVAVAFSFGVDSTFLLKKAQQVLGDQAIAVTALSCLFPGREQSAAKEFCETEGIRQVEVVEEPLSIPGFAENPPERCYLCKRELFAKMQEVARENGMRELVEGSNIDDLGDYRPGLRAVEELGIKSPLRHAGLKKEEIRELSLRMGLPTWKKPSFACLASRIASGEPITEEKLHRVDQAEKILSDLGLEQFRVRMHGESLARIEVEPGEIGRLAGEQTRTGIVEQFRRIGFRYVALDLEGYRMGSMNLLSN